MLCPVSLNYKTAVIWKIGKLSISYLLPHNVLVLHSGNKTNSTEERFSYKKLICPDPNFGPVVDSRRDKDLVSEVSSDLLGYTAA